MCISCLASPSVFLKYTGGRADISGFDTMRDVSIPAWTVLREPSETSGAPSEDELQSRLSSEMVDEIAPASPQRSPEQHKGLDRRPLASGSGDEVAYAQGSSAAVQLRSPAFRKPPSPSCMRRLFPGSDEDEELRPRKKRKRRIVDPEMGLATARTRVSLEGPLPTDGARLAQLSPHVGDASLSTAVDRITLMREARRLRQGTTDSVGLAASGAQSYSKSHVEGRTEKQPIEVGSSYSSQKPIPQVPRSNNAAPLQRAQARRKSSNPSGAVADSSSALSSEAGRELCLPSQDHISNQSLIYIHSLK
ncbi:hypothetical protein BD414DRAFT_267310 [Trametes punicea]|nr:hypothetical protein BD414DRAFT_267310 [Trametes punicea]